MSSDPAAPVAGTDVVERPPRRSDELPAGSTAYWEALTDEMQGDITALRARVAELERAPCDACNGRGWIDLLGGYEETPCRQCNGRVAEIVHENYRLHKALFDDGLRGQLRVELHSAAPTPDPRDTSLPWPCTCGRTDTNGCDRCDPRDARIAVLEAALQLIQTCDPAEDAAWCQGIAQNALGDAHG